MVIAKTQYFYPTRRNYGITFPVILNIRFVNWAIHFDHQPGSMAIEIYDEAVNDLLAAKVKAVQPIRSQISPEDFLLHCHLTPKLFGSLPQRCIHLLPNHYISS
jgi:hypothetical protein